MKKALITGINGQDGSFLAELLLEKGYEVHGIIRRSSTFNTERIEHLYIESLIKDLHSKQKIKLHYGDMTDSTNLIRIIQSKNLMIYVPKSLHHVMLTNKRKKTAWRKKQNARLPARKAILRLWKSSIKPKSKTCKIRLLNVMHSAITT